MMKSKPVRKRLILAGNAQANALADAFSGIAAITDRYDVEYLEPGELHLDTRCDVLFLQHSGTSERLSSLPQAQLIVRFPSLQLGLLWPLSCVNTYDAPEPPAFPHGRFPYGDAYVLNCVKTNTRPEEILPFYVSDTWPLTWPNLDRLFVSESARLARLDKVCDVKVGSYILKHFAKQRLFGAPNSPSWHLLSVLADRLIESLPSRVRPTVSLSDLERALEEGRQHSFLARIELPVHYAVARHFSLHWHAPELQYRHFDEWLGADDYIRRLISHSYAIKTRQEPKPARPPTLLIYGNCQAEAIAGVLENAGNPYRVLYMRSFTEPGSSAPELAQDDVRQCSILWEQHDGTHPFPYREWLPESCSTVTFPSVDFNALWPFTCVNEYANPNPPMQPFGAFPYGDRMIAGLIAQDLEPAEIERRYREDWDDNQVNLDRLLALEFARLRAREAKCDLAISDIISARFREVRLFWTVNHPTNALLQPLVERLIGESVHALPDLQSFNVEQALRKFGEHGPLGVVSVPIHPRVAAHFGLRWYDADAETFQAWGGVTYSYGEYVHQFISDSLNARAAQAVKEPQKI